MTEDRTNPSEPRRGVQRRRPRPTAASTRGPGRAVGPMPSSAPAPATGSARRQMTSRPTGPRTPSRPSGRGTSSRPAVGRAAQAPTPDRRRAAGRRPRGRRHRHPSADQEVRRVHRGGLGSTSPIRQGEVFGLLGPNGAGKTTTVLMLLGLTEPTRGVVRVVGLDPTREPLAVKRQVGYLPDNVGFYGGLTGRENLRYTASSTASRRSRGGCPDRRAARTRSASRTPPTRRPRPYSRGMRQRLGIADALVEEPVRADPRRADDRDRPGRRRGAARRCSGASSREHNLTVLLSSHILGPGPVAVRSGRASSRPASWSPPGRSTSLRGGAETGCGARGGRRGPAVRDRRRSRWRPRRDGRRAARARRATPHRHRQPRRRRPARDRARGGRPPDRPPAPARHRPAGALPPLRPGGYRWPPR